MEMSPQQLQEMIQHAIREGRDQLRQELAEAAEAARAAGPAGLRARITVAELVEKARRLVPEQSQRSYGSIWSTILEGIPNPKRNAGTGSDADSWLVPPIADKWADEVITSDLDVFINPVIERAKQHNANLDRARHQANRTTRDHNGAGAGRNAVSGLRKLFTIAMNDGNCLTNPAEAVKMPKKTKSKRKGFAAERVQELLTVAQSGGDDPELDVMTVQFHLITGARQEGALNLRRRHIDLSAGTVVLDEKNNKVIKQPAPDWFLQALLDFATSRCATGPDDKVFRKREPRGQFSEMGRRRYNTLFERLQASLKWADQDQITAHSVRHSAGTYVERTAGRAVAQLFLRHADETTTDNYVTATEEEVARAVISIWGGSHPLVAA